MHFEDCLMIMEGVPRPKSFQEYMQGQNPRQPEVVDKILDNARKLKDGWVEEYDALVEKFCELLDKIDGRAEAPTKEGHPTEQDLITEGSQIWNELAELTDASKLAPFESQQPQP